MSDAPSDAHQDHGSIRPVGLFVTCFFSSLQILIVSLRLYTRKYVALSIGLDDYLMVGATVFTIGVWILNLLQYSLGLGLHIWDVPPENYVPMLKMVYAVVVLYPAALGLTKLSVLAFYHRVFQGDDTFARLIKITAVLHIIPTIAFTFAFALQCLPVEAIWTFTPIAGAHCINDPALFYFVCAFNCVTDFWVLFMPIPTLLASRLPRRQKIQSIILFSMGGISCIASIVRFYETKKFFSSSTEFYDWTWGSVVKSICSELEFNIAAIAASIPSVKPLLRRFGPLSQISSSSGSHSKQFDGIRSNSGIKRLEEEDKIEEIILTPKGYENQMQNTVMSDHIPSKERFSTGSRKANSYGYGSSPPGIFRSTSVQTSVETV